MTLIEQYFIYLEEISEGKRQPPEGIVLTETDPMKQAVELQEQIMKLGIPEFVRRCAAQDGRELPEEMYDEFQPEDMLAVLQQLAGSREAEQVEAMQASGQTEQPETAVSAEPDPAEPPKIDEPDGPRSAYEVLLDCCCLDEKLLYYMIDVLKRGAEEEFQKLALVTARKIFPSGDFLYWFITKEERAEREEMICVTLLDACFDRLKAQGETELIAALLCGDQKTFELFRCEAPELRQLPEATYEWYERNYLQRWYPIRYMLKFNGIAFPGKDTL